MNFSTSNPLAKSLNANLKKLKDLNDEYKRKPSTTNT